MTVDRKELHFLVDRIPEADLPVTRKLLTALAIDCEVTAAESEGEFTEEARREIEEAEAYFRNGGEGIHHGEILREFGID